jgi:hypothetical protein
MYIKVRIRVRGSEKQVRAIGTEAGRRVADSGWKKLENTGSIATAVGQMTLPLSP